MRSSRGGLLRAAAFFVVLVGLLAPWPGLGRAYAGAFSSVASVVGAPFFSLLSGGAASITLEASRDSDEAHEWFAMVFVRDATTQAPLHRGAADLRRSGYLQIAVFLAFAAAFPLRGKGRWGACALAGVVLLAMLGWLPVWMYLAKKDIVHLGSLAYAALAILQRSLVGAPGMAYFVPAALWLLSVRWVDGQRATQKRLANAT